MDVLQNSRSIGSVFPDYVTVDIFNAALYCNQFVCDFDQLKQFDQTGQDFGQDLNATIFTTLYNNDSVDTIEVSRWSKWSFIFCLFVLAL